MLEVTRFTCQDGEEIRSLLHKNAFVERNTCKSDWHVFLADNAHIGNVRKDVDLYLKDIEDVGLNEFFAPIHARFEPVRKIWSDLRIEGGTKTTWKRPCIGISGSSSGGVACADSIWNDVRPVVYKADNRKKLAESEGNSRHLFIVIDGLQGSAYVSIKHCDPPVVLPDMPLEITHLWLAAEEGAIVYVWLADANGWRDLSNVVNKAQHCFFSPS